MKIQIRAFRKNSDLNHIFKLLGHTFIYTLFINNVKTFTKPNLIYKYKVI